MYLYQRLYTLEWNLKTEPETGLVMEQCLDSTVCVGKYMFFKCFSRLDLAILIYQNQYSLLEQS